MGWGHSIPAQRYYIDSRSLLQHSGVHKTFGDWITWKKLFWLRFRPSKLSFQPHQRQSESKLDGARNRQFPRNRSFVSSKNIPPTAADLGWLLLTTAQRWRRTIRSVQSTWRSDMGKKAVAITGTQRLWGCSCTEWPHSLARMFGGAMTQQTMSRESQQTAMFVLSCASFFNSFLSRQLCVCLCSRAI